MSERTNVYDHVIRHRYGTHRGLVRLWLAHLEAQTGRLDAFRYPELAQVERFVFVCQGNICRSPYAALIAREIGLPTASVGLATTSGHAADDEALAAAGRAGRDLSAHAATALEHFDIRPSDLLLAMEARQARRLAVRGLRAQIALLGFWASPTRPHIHDPLHLGPAYFDTSYAVIESAVRGLAAAWRNTR